MTIIHDDGRDESSVANDSSRSWVGWKERGKQAFIRCDYNVALQSYTKAINQNPGPSTLDRQILLSNIVACRLKLGGKVQAEAAVAIAKKCIALNDKWSKGYVRLASAYIMLDGDDSTYSNDACNALQRALQLDPRNPTAREMLVRELRSRDQRNGNPSAPPQHMDSREYSSSPGGASANNTNRNGTRNGYQNQDDRHNEHHQQQQQPQDQDYNNIDESNNISWKERMQFNIQKVCGWYLAQSEDIKTLLKIFSTLVLLYVAFGGRFGVEYLINNDNNRNANSRSGSYRTDNVYEEFYRDRNQRNLQHNRQQSSHHHREHYDSSSYDSRHHRQRSHSSSSWWDGSSSSGYYYHMLLMGSIAFVARYFGISPYQAIFFANMVMGRGGGRRGGMMGGNMRHRPGGMWR
mmetsp:Transcript_23480/g.26158  ORF Transcript_23480/g.26158 Transcript_23480/m.26158 type:complete len:406 (-) Transcript_23480:150-1367(-)